MIINVFVKVIKKYLNKKIYLANHDHCGPCGQIQDFKIKK